MADEITVSATLHVAKGEYEQSESVAAVTFDWSGDKFTGGVMAVTNAAGGEALPLGDIPTNALGWAWFRNVDASATVEIGVDVAGNFSRMAVLEPGDVAIFPFEKNVTPKVKASAADAKLEHYVFED